MYQPGPSTLWARFAPYNPADAGFAPPALSVVCEGGRHSATLQKQVICNK